MPGWFILVNSRVLQTALGDLAGTGCWPLLQYLTRRLLIGRRFDPRPH